MASKTLILDNRYKIKKKLGAGGMATVYLADDLEQGFEVAIKILPPALADKPQYLDRFKREFNVCSKLDHPNVVKLFSCGETPDKASWYYAMEVLCCDDLQEILTEKTKLKPVFVLQLALQMARAFKHFHSRGVVHRDLKPANIMVETNGRVVIMDFGLVHDPSMTQLTKTGTVMGTPRYMSPELLKGWKVDPRSDIFQLGSIIHECLCGKSAFQGESIVELGGNILLGKYTPICTVDPSVPKEWEIFLSNCLVTNRDNRYQSADQVLKDLEKMMLKKPIELIKPTLKSSKGAVARDPLSASRGASSASRRASSADSAAAASLKSSGISGSADLMKSSNFAKRPILESSAGDSLQGIHRPFSVFKGMFTAGRLAVLAGLVIFIFLLNAFGSAVPKAEISVFRALGGMRGGLLLWASDQKCLTPVIKIYKIDKSRKNDAMEVEFSSRQPVISEVVKDSGNVLYSHSVVVSNLEEDSDYSVILLSAVGGSQSLPRSFSTKAGEPLETLELKPNGDLHFVYESSAPFSCEVGSDNLVFEGESLDTSGSYFSSVRMVLPFGDLQRNSPIAYKIETIDGKLLFCKKTVFEKFEEYFKLISAQFFDSRKVTENDSGITVPFFDMWANDSSRNYIYDEYADTFAKLTDESTREELIDEFWTEVEKKMKADCNWYRALYPLLPGLPVFLKKVKISLKFRQSIAFSLLGLEIMQGAAVAARLPDNPHWITCIRYNNRPFPCTGKSTLEPIDVEITGRQSIALFEDLKLPVYLIQDPSVPQTYWKLKNSPLHEFHSEQVYNFELSDDPSDFSKAEIVVDLRTCGNPSMVGLLNVNEDEFVATVRTTRANFLALYEAWAKSSNYDGVILMALSDKGNVLTADHAKPITYGSKEGAIRDYDKKMRTMHNALPKYEGSSIYHPLPLEALKRGMNKVKLTVLTGPSMAFDPWNYKTIRILLTR